MESSKYEYLLKGCRNLFPLVIGIYLKFPFFFFVHSTLFCLYAKVIPMGEIILKISLFLSIATQFNIQYLLATFTFVGK